MFEEETLTHLVTKKKGAGRVLFWVTERTQCLILHGSKQLSYSRVLMKVHGSCQKVSPKKTKFPELFLMRSLLDAFF